MCQQWVPTILEKNSRKCILLSVPSVLMEISKSDLGGIRYFTFKLEQKILLTLSTCGVNCPKKQYCADNQL